MKFADALAQSLLRTALFAETHSIKGVLAADRLAKRCQGLPASFFGDSVALFQVLSSPRVSGPLRGHIVWDEPLDDGRIEGTIGRAVFPLAYEAASLWVERRGLSDLVMRYRRRAVARISHLGHAWTIWCSFCEVLTHLPSRADQLLCAERFVELVAAQLSHNDPSRPGPDEEVLDGPPANGVATLDAALHQPGFFGHTLTTLGYLYRHRDKLDEAEWRWAIARVDSMAAHAGGADGAAIATPAPDASASASDADVEAAAVRLVLEGPREVHAITLADSAFDLAAVATPRQKAHLVAVLGAVTRWDPAR